MTKKNENNNNNFLFKAVPFLNKRIKNHLIKNIMICF